MLQNDSEINRKRGRGSNNKGAGKNNNNPSKAAKVSKGKVFRQRNLEQRSWLSSDSENSDDNDLSVKGNIRHHKNEEYPDLDLESLVAEKDAMVSKEDVSTKPTPLVTSTSLAKKQLTSTELVRKTPRKLENTDNICFFNSIVQALYS